MCLFPHHAARIEQLEPQSIFIHSCVSGPCMRMHVRRAAQTVWACPAVFSSVSS